MVSVLDALKLQFPMKLRMRLGKGYAGKVAIFAIQFVGYGLFYLSSQSAVEKRKEQNKVQRVGNCLQLTYASEHEYHLCHCLLTQSNNLRTQNKLISWIFHYRNCLFFFTNAYISKISGKANSRIKSIKRKMEKDACVHLFLQKGYQLKLPAFATYIFCARTVQKFWWYAKVMQKFRLCLCNKVHYNVFIQLKLSVSVVKLT